MIYGGGRKPKIKYFHVFESTCYTLYDREQRSKFDPKSDECIFLGYSIKRRAYWVFNELIKSMMVSINVIINYD